MDITNGLPSGHNDMANTLKEMLKISTPTESSAQEHNNHHGSGDAINTLTKDYSPPSQEISSTEDQNNMSQNIILENVADGECVRLLGEKTQIISNINTETDCPTTASNQVKINTITKFEWEHRYYSGSLISVTNLYMAYSIKGRGNYSVRVINRHNSSDRVLLKGFTGCITDVAFSHSTSTTLGAVDNMGNLIVWDLNQVAGNIVYEKRIHVVAEESIRDDPTNHRVIWIPCVQTDQTGEESCYEPAKAEPSDPSTLVLAYRSTAEVWDLAIAYQSAMVLPDYTVSRTQARHAFVAITGHDDDITDCELSPIGNVLAAASYDGFVKFWQVQIEDTEPPTCLHHFKPHDGKPVNTVRFCDDKNQSELTVYWRFLLTGCDRNIELKLWCTVSWDCLQVIKFEPPTPAHVQPEINLILHRSADYLILTDINRKVLYIMQVKSDLEAGQARIESIAHYQLASPVLSTALIDVKPCKFKSHVATAQASPDRSNRGSDFDSDDDNDDEDKEIPKPIGDITNDTDEKLDGVLVKLLTIQPRSMQSLDIRFIPSDGQMNESKSGSTYNTTSEDIKDLVSVGSVDERVSLLGAEKKSNDDTYLAAGDSMVSPTQTASSTFVGDDDKVTNDAMPNQPTDSNSLIDVASEVGFGSDKPQSDEERVAPDVTCSSSPPVLLTPDAFMGLLKSPGKSSEAANSSFTVVTPFSTMGGSFFQQSQDGGGRNSLSSLMKSPSTSRTEELPLDDSNAIKTPPSSPILPQASSSPPVSSSAKTPNAAAEILQAFCSRPLVKSPDLISSTSTLDEVKHDASGPVPISTPPGLPRRTFNIGSAVAGESSDQADVFASVLIPVTSSSVVSGASAWPKAPDVTMSRPIVTRSPPPSTSQQAMNQNEKVIEALPLSASVHQNQAAVAFSQPPTADNQPIIDSIKDLQQQQETLLAEHQKKLEAISKKQIQLQKQADSSIKRSEQQGEKLEKSVKTLTETQRKLSADLKTNQSALMDSSSAKIDRVVKAEMKRTVLPGMTANLELVKDQLNTTVAQQLTATDTVLKESITKFVKSKEMVDTTAAATAKALHDQIKSSLPEIFFSTLIPAFERSCQAMFQQLSATYHRGMEETVKQLEKQMQFRMKADQDKLQGTVKDANDAVAQLQAVSKQTQSDLTTNIQQQFSSNIEKTLTSFEERITANVLEAIKQQQEKNAAEQRRVITDVVRDVVSRTLDEKIPLTGSDAGLSSSPVVGVQTGTRSLLGRPSIVDQQQLILKMLQQGNVNTAFQTALTASNLGLVMYVCETVDPAVVFGVTPCPLQQPILLSLIQQLSSDLANKTAIKLKYLQEAVMNLDRRHQITKEYMHSVLSALVQKLQACAQGPLEDQGLAKDLKMLAMAAQSLMK